MRLVMACLTAAAASTAILGLLFVYALYVPTIPAPSVAITEQPAKAWTGPGAPRILAAASDVR